MRNFVFITGPMFSGKTEELLRIKNRYSIANKPHLLFKPKKDQRYGKCIVQTHNSHAIVALEIKKFDDIFPYIANSREKIEAVFIDEIQFIESVSVDIIRELTENQGIKLYVCGLTLDSFRNPFPNMKHILPYSKIIQLTSVCSFCGDLNAEYTYRKNSENTKQVFIGASSEYSAICHNCIEKGNYEE